MGLDLFDHLRRHAAQRGDDPAVRVIGPLAERHEPLTWRGLEARVRGVAAALDRALPPDAVVMLVSPNRPAVAAAFLGVIASGRTVFPVDAALTAVDGRALTFAVMANDGVNDIASGHVHRFVVDRTTFLARLSD